MGKRHRIKHDSEALDVEDTTANGHTASPSNGDVCGTPASKSELKEKKKKKRKDKKDGTSSDAERSTEKKKRKKHIETEHNQTLLKDVASQPSGHANGLGKNEDSNSMKQQNSAVHLLNGSLENRYVSAADIPLEKRLKKNRKALFNGPARARLLHPKHVRNLSEQEQYAYFTETSGICERLLYLMHDTIFTGNAWKKSQAADASTTVEESLTNDLIRLKKVPLAKQYVEMNLWRRIVQFNKEQLSHASRIGYGKGEADVNPYNTKQGLLLHGDADPDAKFVAFKDAHMKTVIERFGSDLEKMREAEHLTAEKVQFLLRCLESGANLFSNLKCLDDGEAADV